LTLHVDLRVTVAECSSEIVGPRVNVDVNYRVNHYVAVKLKVLVDVEVLVQGLRIGSRPRVALFYRS